MSRSPHFSSPPPAPWFSSGIQALSVVYVPLLFLHFQREMGITLAQLGSLMFFNFGTQFLMDMVAAKYADRLGIRRCLVASQGLMGLGIASLSLLTLLPSPFLGLCLASILYGMGGGLVEVLTSPTVEACPTRNKVASMAFLHSTYCIGCIAIILVSTLFFATFGIHRWRWLTLFWGILPLANAWNFSRVPMPRPLGQKEGGGLSIRHLATLPLFWLLVALMILAGAIEQAMSQWASAFAESSLQVSKSMGDLMGACFFAALMFVSRSLFGHAAHRLDLKVAMTTSAILCLLGFLLTILSPWPPLALAGLGLSGFAVGILWPGTLSLAAQQIPRGGTPMFGMCALGGDIGCTLGPALVGWCAAAWGNNLRHGLAAGLAFCLLLLACLFAIRKAAPGAPEKEG